MCEDIAVAESVSEDEDVREVVAKVKDDETVLLIILRL